MYVYYSICLSIVLALGIVPDILQVAQIRVAASTLRTHTTYPSLHSDNPRLTGTAALFLNRCADSTKYVILVQRSVLRAVLTATINQ